MPRMKSLFSVLFGNTLARDYAIAGAVVCVLAVFGVQAMTHLIDSTRQNARVQQVSISQGAETVRNYQVSRSVLDDQVVTGSISPRERRPIILDPCTGEVKQK
jgi:hypothetical protein